jgi:hypothetical protein
MMDESLYSKWKKEGAFPPLLAESGDQSRAFKASFVAYKIKADYSAFGDLD